MTTPTRGRNQYSALEVDFDSEPKTDQLSRSFVGEPTEKPTLSYQSFKLDCLWIPAEPEQKTPETTNSLMNYETAPVLSEPAEHLYKTLLEQRNLPGVTTALNKEKTKTKSTNKQTEMATMVIDPTLNGKLTKLKLSPPKSFMRKRGELDEFIQDVCLYININEGIYDTNKKKIRYVLSFMNEGDAKSWKKQFLRNAQMTTGLDLGTWNNFIKDLTKASNLTMHQEMH